MKVPWHSLHPLSSTLWSYCSLIMSNYKYERYMLECATVQQYHYWRQFITSSTNSLGSHSFKMHSWLHRYCLRKQWQHSSHTKSHFLQKYNQIDIDFDGEEYADCYIKVLEQQKGSNIHQTLANTFAQHITNLTWIIAVFVAGSLQYRLIVEIDHRICIARRM